MVLVTGSKPRRLLYLSLIARVERVELIDVLPEIEQLLKELEPGFRLLTDCGRLDSVDVKGAAEIGKVMELCDKKGVSLVVRVIPDPAKDIGMNILSLFHYHSRPRTVTCETLLEACRKLAL